MEVSIISVGQLQKGDIILSTTSDSVSKVVKFATNSKYSHARIYIGNSQVIEAIKLKRNHLAKQAVKSFIKGDLVQFTNKNGMRVNATVEKVNKKYIVVDAHIGGQKWRVPATMLTKLSDIGMSA